MDADHGYDALGGKGRSGFGLLFLVPTSQAFGSAFARTGYVGDVSRSYGSASSSVDSEEGLPLIVGNLLSSTCRSFAEEAKTSCVLAGRLAARILSGNFLWSRRRARLSPHAGAHLCPGGSTTMADQLPFTNVELATNPEPRCPCVLLLDVSGSMAEVVADAGKSLGQTVQQDGKSYEVVSGGVTRIALLNEGLRAYHGDLLNDPLATQRVEVSIITFGGEVQSVTPFVSARDFSPPMLVANGATPMGSAIVAAIDAVTERKRLYRENGLHYYRPWIFFITDGEPTDAWQAAAAKVREGEKSKAFAFFAVGVEGANFDILRQIATREPLRLKGYSFREMFIWLSQSQRSVSQSTPGQEDQVKLASPAGWATL